MGWQPIETAPKNNTEVLVYSKEFGVAKAVRFDEGSYEVVTEQTCCRDYYKDVTHWMQLPEPPETTHDIQT